MQIRVEDIVERRMVVGSYYWVYTYLTAVTEIFSLSYSECTAALRMQFTLVLYTAFFCRLAELSSSGVSTCFPSY